MKRGSAVETRAAEAREAAASAAAAGATGCPGGVGTARLGGRIRYWSRSCNHSKQVVQCRVREKDRLRRG